MHTSQLCKAAGIAALLCSVSGCATPRALVWPGHMDHEKQEHIYFVEQEQQKDSRIKKCDILPDNRVTCAVQYDLQQP